MIFDNNTQRYMYKYLETNNVQIYFSHLLLTLDVPLQIGKCTPEVYTYPRLGTPGLEYQIKCVTLCSNHYAKLI